MAKAVNDLWPSVSGAASLGAEMTNGGFTGMVRPFATVHMNSGVFHSPVFGTSGIIRFRQSEGRYLELSANGGERYSLGFGTIDNFPDPPASWLNGSLIRSFGKMYMQASGVQWDIETAPDAGDGLQINVRRGFDKSSQNANISIGSEDQITIDGDRGILLASNDSLAFLVNPDINASVGTIGFDVLAQQNNTTGAGGQIRLRPFNSSGQLKYHFGPYEAWHTNPSTNGASEGPLGDGFFPIPHSGQVFQMILENDVIHTLQEAYDAGQRITVGINGPVHIDGDSDYALHLQVLDGDSPHILMSGVNELIHAGEKTPGALWMQAHSAGMDGHLGGTSGPLNREQTSAKSLGIDTLFYTTGSGIVSVRAASGVSQFFNISAGATIDENGLIVPLSTETTPSTFYHQTTTSGVQIYVPGLYRITYSAIIEKTAGNLAQGVGAEIRLRDKWGQEFRFLGSQSAAILRDSNDLNENSCSGQTLVDLHSGDSIVVFLQHNGIPPAANTVRAKSRASNVIVEWIGPLAGGGIVRQKV